MQTAWHMVLAGLLWACGVPAIAQELTATLDRSTIFEGETVLLKIELLNPDADVVPDYTVLGTDFRLLDTGTNSSLEVTNGRRRLVVQHNVLLEPRRAGEIVLPPIPVGTQQTQPLTMMVMTRPDGSRAPDQDVYIETDVEPTDPYVHGQIRFTVRLIHAPPITEGSLTPEAWPDGLVVERIGEDQTYQTRIGEARYRVIERRYALFPERSGTLELPEVQFRGRVADPNQGRTTLFSRGRRVSVASQPIQLEVRPQPADFTGSHWLPAATLEVTEVWPDGEPVFVQGEPVTRTLVVKARGLLAAQLPELDLPEIDGVKIYPDQATTRTHADAGWAVAQREQKFALVPTRTGAMTLPEIRVPWWDTEADAMRTFVIAARQINVLPGSAALAPPPEPVMSSSPAGLSATANGARNGGTIPWRELAWLFAALWLLFTALWWRGRPAATPEAAPSPEPEQNWRRKLDQACNAGDPRAAANAAVNAIAFKSGLPVHSLAAAANTVTSERLADELLALDRLLYRNPGEPWDGAELKSLMSRLAIRSPDSGGKRSATGPLPPLYPA